MAGKLSAGAAYEDTAAPITLFPNKLERSEKAKYRAAMRVVSTVVNAEQDKIFRAKEPDEAKIVLEGKNLDLQVRKWLAEKEHKQLNVQQKANCYGVGRRALQLPESAWPKPNGGLFGYFTGR